jgi:hypothetical protein
VERYWQQHAAAENHTFDLSALDYAKWHARYRQPEALYDL